MILLNQLSKSKVNQQYLAGYLPDLDSRFRTHPLVDDPHMKKLWQGLETWLIKQFPQATRIVTPFHDPIAHSIEEYQTFLRSQGFERVAKAAFGKSVKR